MLSELTKGEIMFYGGMAGMAFLILLSIVLALVFARKKKKLIKKIEEEF